MDERLNSPEETQVRIRVTASVDFDCTNPTNQTYAVVCHLKWLHILFLITPICVPL